MKPPLHVDQFVQHYPRLIHARGRLIISADMPTDQAYYLISGRAHAKSHPKPRSRMGKDFAAGDMISFVSFLALDHYDLDIVASSACEVLAIPRLVIENHWGKEDIASWLFACSMASEVVKKQQPVMVGFAI